MQLEKTIERKKQEEEDLGKNLFGLTGSINSVSTSTLDQSSKQYSVEELERLRNALKENLMMQQNKLKFLFNDQNTLVKNEHVDRVCEAFFESEKTWFAALIQDIDDEE